MHNIIHYSAIVKIMTDGLKPVGKGELFRNIKERCQLTEPEIMRMMESASVRTTQAIGSLIRPNIEIQMNHGNMIHCIFTYDCKGEFISAIYFNSKGRWDEMHPIKG